MASPDREPRLRFSKSPPPHILIRWSWAGLVMSLLLLALAPLAVADSYSVFRDTLSESGGQGVEGAWVFRAGVLSGSAAVFTMTAVARWAQMARFAMQIYALALIGLVVFPEAPWDGQPYNETIAFLHTVAGVVGATAFIVAAVLVSVARPADHPGTRAFDWLVVMAIASIPQVMLLVPADGVLQRVMVGLGYVWLFAELARISDATDDARRNPTASIRNVLPWTGDRTRPD